MSVDDKELASAISAVRLESCEPVNHQQDGKASERLGDAPIQKRNKKDKKGPRTQPSQEEIETIRAERLAAKKIKEKEQQKYRHNAPEYQFITRPLLKLPSEKEPIGQIVSIMTYNCLAQSLIRRKLFPTSGNALKWTIRGKVLIDEFKHYNADILCLQEIDVIQYEQFWRQELGLIGYISMFHRSYGKPHGVAIAWKRSMFEKCDHMLVDYDSETCRIERRTTTKNVGLFTALRFTDKVRQLHQDTKRSGVIVGTTHLFWHPFGTYERTRQTYIMLKKMKEFMHRVNILQNNNDGDLSHWYPFICGDFNSQPYDSPYLSIVSKPISYKDRAKVVISCSLAYQFSSSRDGEAAEKEAGGNVEKFGLGQPQTPVPDKFEGDASQIVLVKQMEELHNSLDMRAISLYSVGYKHVHPENSGLDNDRGEPEISNWANTWRGLLDYIFFVLPWDYSNHVKEDSLSEFQCSTGVKILGLLRMPPAKEMPEYGQPHIGEYPSDHLSMMCELELEM